MAFGFSKGETVQGDIKGADDANRDTKIDFEENYIGLEAGGSAVLVVSGSSVGIGTTTPDYTLDVAGNIGVNQYIYHNGDGNTWINFTDNRIRLNAGGNNFIDCEDPGSAPHKVRINNGGNNIDFVIKDNSGNVYFTADASTSRVGIGTDSPSVPLHVDGNALVAALVITGSEVSNTYATTTSTAMVAHGSIEIKTTGNTEALRITKENNSDVREIVFENAGTDAQEIYTTGDALVIRNGINNEDIVFRLKSAGSNNNMFRLDASAKNISINSPSVIVDQCITNNGGYAGRVTSVTSTYTVADGDWLLACSGDSTKTINLPAASSNTGRVLHIKDIDGNANSYNITLDGNGSETIDGSTTYAITQNRASVTIVCTGVTWAIVSMYSGPPPGGP